MSKAVTGNNVVSWKLWGGITLPEKEKKAVFWVSTVAFLTSAKQMSATSETLCQRHWVNSIAKQHTKDIIIIKTIIFERRGGQHHDLHFLAVCSAETPLANSGIRHHLSPLQFNPLKHLVVTGASVKVAATVAVARTEHPHPSQSDTEEWDGSPSAKRKVRRDVEPLRTVYLVWIPWIVLDSVFLHYSPFGCSFFFRSQHANDSSKYDFLVSVAAKLFLGCCICEEHERWLFGRSGQELCPVSLGHVLRWPASGHGLPAYVQTVREIQQGKPPQGRKHCQEFQSQSRCVNTSINLHNIERAHVYECFILEIKPKHSILCH